MRKLVVLFTLFTCVALSPLTATNAGAASASTATRPFIVFAKGTVTPGSSDVTGSFLATQLGFGQFTEASTLLFINGPIVVFATHVVLTAATGETVVTDGAIVEFPSVTPTCHGGSFAGGATITGGTGRFAHATGQVQTTGCNDSTVTPPVITAFSKGQITF